MMFCSVKTLLVSGKQESSGVCDDVSEDSAEHHGGIQRAGSSAASGGTAVHYGDADGRPEGRGAGQASGRGPAASVTATLLRGVVDCVQHCEEDRSSSRSDLS